MKIIESIGGWGVKTSDLDYLRYQRPHIGDVVQFSKELMRYPVSHEFARIVSYDESTGRFGLVDGMGGAFMCEDGSLIVSGGPFFGLFSEHLEPGHSLHDTKVWNWGDNSPGGNQGVYYTIQRPVFLAKVSPFDFEQRIASSEKQARDGGLFGRSAIPEHATLYQQFLRIDGEHEFWFDMRDPRSKAEPEETATSNHDLVAPQVQEAPTATDTLFHRAIVSLDNLLNVAVGSDGWNGDDSCVAAMKAAQDIISEVTGRTV